MIHCTHEKDGLHMAFRSAIACSRAAELLNSGAGLLPALLEQRGKTLTVEEPEGISLPPDAPAFWEGVARWLSAWAETPLGRKAVLPGLSPEHFYTLPNGRLLCVKLSDWRSGEPWENIGELLASLPEGHPAAKPLLTMGGERFGVGETALRQTAQRARAARRLESARREKAQDVTAVLLAGGKSSRMGRPKHLLMLDGFPFWEHTLYAMERYPHMAVSVAEERPEFSGLPQWPDERKGLGPLAALEAVLRRAETPAVLVAPCDAPFVTEAFLDLLLDCWREDVDCVVIREKEGLNPLMGLYRRSLLPAVSAALDRGERRPASVLKGARMEAATVPEGLRQGTWNLNTPEEYARALDGREP